MAQRTHVTRITEAEVSQEQDLHDRTVRYLFSMGLRMVCFILAVVTPSPWRWLFAAGAIVLPWIAVLLANAVRTRGVEPGSAVIDGAPAAALGSGPPRSADTAEPDPGGGTAEAAGDREPRRPPSADGVYEGEIIDDAAAASDGSAAKEDEG